ncbi:AAA family ATPase [Paenibacillus sp. NPDC058071]|uniref:AAA family ATPase n=1 Tax=Paenibacillus sp. NPDC058071 TaxID=3346326 RepID=UPI0036D7B907
MKLLEARIDGFGQLSGLVCPLNAPSVVLYGLNEAGKSTLFQFIRTMLYGFARRGTAERMEPVRGGSHGGSLLFEDEAGRSYIAERYAGVNGGKLKLRSIDDAAAEAQSPDESWPSQEEWERRFLGGTSERLFRQWYAITLSELQEIGTLSGEELSRHLYHAGWDGGRAIAAAEKKLRQEMDSLFKPRGSQQMNRELKKLEQIEAELRKRTDAIAAYNGLSRELARTEAELARLDAALPGQSSEAQLLDKAVAIRPQWLRRMELGAQQEKLSSASAITEEAEHRWNELQREQTACREELEQAELELLVEEKRRETLSFDEQLLGRIEEAEALLLASERMGMLKREQAELGFELRADEETIGRLIGRISPEWTEEQLLGLSATVADREQARGFREASSEADRAEERLSGELRLTAEQEREAVLSLADIDGELETVMREQAAKSAESGVGFRPQTSEALQAAWDSCEMALRDWEQEQQQQYSASRGAERDSGPGRGGELAGAALWAGAAATSAIAVTLGAFAVGGGADTSAAPLAAGAAGAGAAAFAFATAAIVRGRGRARAKAKRAGGALRRAGAGTLASVSDGNGEAKPYARGTAGSAAAARADAALAALLEAPAQAAAALSAARTQRSVHAAGELASEAVAMRERLRPAVLARLDGLRRSERLAVGREEQARRLERLRASLAARRDEAQEEAQRRETAADGWSGWLRERGLPASMSPDAALAAFELTEQAVGRLYERDRRAAKRAAATRQLAAFEAKAAELCAAVPEAAAQVPADPGLALRLLQAELRRQTEAKREATRLDERRQSLSLRIGAAESRLMRLLEAQERIAQAAGLANRTQFAAALAHRPELLGIEAELSKLAIELAAGVPDTRLEELERLLRSHDEEELKAKLSEARERTGAAEDERAKLLEEKGRIRQRLDHLAGEEEHQRLLAGQSMSLARLAHDAERYAVLAVSAQLIRATKRVYEEEKQPVVLRLASSYVNELTEGRYIRVLSPPGESGLKLETADRRLIDSAALSRGTAELVYLAMRLALAEEAAKTARLPLLLDDLFVNFDGGRMRAAVRLLGRLAQSRQLLLFTCHEHIRDRFVLALPSAAAIELRGPSEAIVRHPFTNDQIEPTKAD